MSLEPVALAREAWMHENAGATMPAEEDVLLDWWAERCRAIAAAPSPGALTFEALRGANESRRDRWHTGADDWTGADWSNAMCGEAGEAANVVKKLRRRETGIGSQYNTPETPDLLAKLGEELADVAIYADLVAAHYGIDLAAAVVGEVQPRQRGAGIPGAALMQIPGVHIETITNPCHYTPAQLDRACAIAQVLNRGKLVLCETPQRADCER